MINTTIKLIALFFLVTAFTGCASNKSLKAWDHFGKTASEQPECPALPAPVVKTKWRVPRMVEDIWPGVAYFDHDSSELNEDALAMAHKVARWFKGTRGAAVRVLGRTSNKGGDKYNLLLSRRRAEAFATELLEKGVPWFRISVEGEGKGKENTGKYYERRVEVYVAYPSKMKPLGGKKRRK